MFPLEGFSVGNVASLLSTFPSVVSLGVVPSVCFFSSVDFEVVVSFVSVVTGVFAGFTTAGAWSDFFASTLAVVVGVWSTFGVSALPIVDCFSVGWLDTKV